MKCLRCDWRSTVEEGPAREQLAEHATDAGHPVCPCCGRSLTVDEKRTCEPCLTESRSLLAGIALMHGELPRHLGQLRGASPDVVASGEKPVTGGEVLVLAGPGSGGTAARVLWPSEVKAGKVQGLDGREHHQDNYLTSAMSVAGVLCGWEDDWRHVRQEPAAVVVGGTAAAIRAAVGYLEVHTRWAATEHPGFDEYHRELTELHARLERATGRDEKPIRAEARCFDCSGTLLRLRKDGKPCTHTTPPQWPDQYRWDPERGRGVLFRSAADVRAEFDRTVVEWDRSHTVCVQGGFSDLWECGRCHRAYQHAEYVLAVAQQLRDTAVGWASPQHVALVLGVEFRTVQSWGQRGLVATACALELDDDGRPIFDKKRQRMRGDKAMRVSYEEVADRVHRRRETEQRRQERQQLRERTAS